MKPMAKMLGLAVICGALLSGTPAKAWYDSDGNWHSGHWHSIAENRVVFRDTDRVFLEHYIDTNGVYCRAGGLAGNKQCVARPGNDVFYRPGMMLPETVSYEPLPSSVTQRLAPAPTGTVYVRANDNIYLMNQSDRTVVDSVNLFSDIR